jgi:dienelactone hydrolase
MAAVTAPQTVTVNSPDGVNLVGSFFESAKPNSPALLMLHEWQSDRHSFDDFAKRMQAKGFNVLSIDGRGFGESTKTSDGKPVTAGRTDADVKGMLGDLGAAFDYLAKQKNVDPNHIGIVGASYGSSLALIYAADNPRVAALALLSPGLNYFGNMQTEPAAEKYGKRPMFLIAAEDDKESADAVRNLAAVNNNGMYGMLVYPSGGHGTALFKLTFPNHERPELAESLEWFFTSRFNGSSQ